MNNKKWLYLVCLSEIFCILVMSNYSAVLPLIQQEWGLTNTQAGMINSAYQIGYITLVVFLTTLTDYVDAKKIYVFSSLWAGVSGILFSILANGLLSALILRSLTGFGIAGTYMPGMKMVSSKFDGDRGKAMGLYVGAYSIGMGLSLFISGILTRFFHWRIAFFITSLGPVIGSFIAYKVMDPMPPLEKTEKRLERNVKKFIFANPAVLIMVLVYMAHTWELFGVRSWIVAYLGTILSIQMGNISKATSISAIISSIIVGIGGFSTALAGMVSDRFDRMKTIQVIMFISALLSFTIGWLKNVHYVLVILCCIIYGLFITAESSVISTVITEQVPYTYLGATMALQSFMGWGTAGISPIVFGFVLDKTNPLPLSESVGFTEIWGPAFCVLGLGSLVGPIVIYLGRNCLKQVTRAHNVKS